MRNRIKLIRLQFIDPFIKTNMCDGVKNELKTMGKVIPK